ncbi:MAG: hypothetical protein ACRDRN_22025 [Sciscionella sp.]
MIDSVPEKHRDTFVQILKERNSTLLAELRAQEKPTLDQADTVTDIFASSLIANLDENDDPTEWGVKINDALGVFVSAFPSDELPDYPEDRL